MRRSIAMQTKSSIPSPGSSANTPSHIRIARVNGSSRVKISRNHRLRRCQLNSVSSRQRVGSEDVNRSRFPGPSQQDRYVHCPYLRLNTLRLQSLPELRVHPSQQPIVYMITLRDDRRRQCRNRLRPLHRLISGEPSTDGERTGPSSARHS